MSERGVRLERMANASVGPFTVVEVLPVAFLVPVVLWETVLGHADVLSGPPWAVALLLCAAAVALLWRRRRPLLVLAVIALLGLVQLLLLGSSQAASGPLCLAVAVFACGAHGMRPYAYAGIAIGVVAVLIGTWAENADTFADSWAWSLNVLWIFGLGALVRWQMLLARRAREAAEARAAAESAEQRLSLARDLHDVLAHSLAVMIVQAEAADELVDADPSRARAALARVEVTGRAALSEIRGLVETLRADDASGSTRSSAVGLDRLTMLLDSVRASGLPVDLRLKGDLDRVPGAMGLVVYRVVQEALTNALRHAGSAAADVTIDVVPEHEVRVRVHNTGAPTHVPVGARHEDTRPSTGGRGLQGMRERVVEAGGRFEAGPDSDGGFNVTALLPWDRSGG